MHTAFTGSIRKTRQVNLSGRPTVNPWASIPGTAKSSHGQAGPSSTLALAQADRQRRQQERDRLNASRKIQRTWRSHNSRRKQKAQWRHDWDDNEQQRLSGTHDPLFEHLLDPGFEAPAYTTADLLFTQLQLLNRFQEFRQNAVRCELDTARLLFFANGLQHSEHLLPASHLDTRSCRDLARLATTAAQHILSIKAMPSNTRTQEAVRQLAVLLAFLARLVPEQLSRTPGLYMQVLKEMIDSHSDSAAEDSAVETLVSLLEQKNSAVYQAFIQTLISTDGLSQNKRVLSSLSEKIDLSALSRAVTDQTRSASDTATGTSTDDKTLWQLSYLVYMHGKTRQTTSESNLDYIQALSVLLRVSSSAIRDRAETPNFDTSTNTSSANAQIPPFITNAIESVCHQDFIQQAVTILSNRSSISGPTSVDSSFDIADRLAEYALSVMSAFEAQKMNVRRTLYQSTVLLPSGGTRPTISYFWSIMAKTRIFQAIVKDERKVLSILTHAAPDQQQIGSAPLSGQQVCQWMAEWRIILAFLELYSFALKLMDDEDFFSASESPALLQQQKTAGQWRKGALPLSEVAILITFLKHLAFSLYWNASQLIQSSELDEPERLSALFGSLTPHKEATVQPSAPVKLAGNDVTHAYLKDLTTSLLRMLHERDSRRKFLGEKHFLVSDQLDLTGFISDVVDEEEKRYQMQDGDNEDAQDIDIEEAGEPEDFEPDNMLASIFGIRQPHAPRSFASRQAQKREQQKSQSRKRRQLQMLAPRLEILRNLPFFIPFEVRVQIFRGFILKDQIRRRDGFVEPDNWRMHIASSTQGRDLDGRPRGFDIISRHHAEIHREAVFEDAFAAFYSLADALKEPIQISFIDKFGAPEAGIDGGGVTKEFLMSVTNEALDPDQDDSMFVENDQRLLFPNPLLYEETSYHLQQLGLKEGSEAHQYNLGEVKRRYEFLGRIIGKCLYEGILIDVNFAGFFLLKWALTGGTTMASRETTFRASINDLRDYDEALYQGLLKLKNYTADVEQDFGLNFTVTDKLKTYDSRGQPLTIATTKKLEHNGDNIPVTNANKYNYIDRIVRYRLQYQPKAVTDAFLNGLNQIISPMWLAMFNQKELQKLVGGDNTELDIADLRRNTRYGGLYVIGDDGLEHPTIELFWKVLKDMDDADRRKVLKFVTSTPRAPLLGFSHLNPKFSIRDSGSGDQDRLPSTSTCVNLLKLPRYGDVKTMREKLLYAVNSGAGFDLS
ncbi:hypothetical protein DV736_g5810, partial [Chaetothyriales sp. CBS 134916]